MQIRLLRDMFEEEVCDMQTDAHGLVLSRPGGERLAIPFRELRHFSLEGRGSRLRYFVLESDGRSLEGVFCSAEDAENFAVQLRERSRCYVDLRLDMTGEDAAEEADTETGK